MPCPTVAIATMSADCTEKEPAADLQRVLVVPIQLYYTTRLAPT